MHRALVALMLVACSGPTDIVEEKFPPIVAVAFPGWPNPADLAGGTSNSHDDPRQSGTFQADWTSREPVHGFAEYGTGVDAQARVDAIISVLSANGVDAIAPLIIIPEEIYGATVDADPIRQAMSTPFKAYLTSSLKQRLKFIPLLQSISLRYPYPGFPGHLANDTDGGAYITQWGAYVAGLLNDPQCMTLSGVKAVGMYDTPEWPTAMHTAFKAAVAAAGGPPFVLVDWSHSSSDAVRLGSVAIVNYPPNPGLPPGNGQHPYLALATINTALATPTGVGFCGVISYRQDQRPLSHSGSDAVTPWVDEPSLVEHFQTAYAMLRRTVSGFSQTLVSVHALDEFAEGGQGYEPSKQADRDQPGGARALEAIGWAKNPLTRPPTYKYSLSIENSLIVKTGTWTMSRILGGSWSVGDVVYDNRILSSNTPGDTLGPFSHIACTALAIYGEVAPGLGSFTVALDGGAPVTVSCTGSAAHHQLLWTSGPLTQGTHTILVTVASGLISPDAIQIACNPLAFPFS